jgi:hypothetical protein
MSIALTEFLLARIAEDEITAHYAILHGPLDRNEIFGGQWFGWVTHAERHLPAHVLAEYKAKRAIIAVVSDKD